MSDDNKNPVNPFAEFEVPAAKESKEENVNEVDNPFGKADAARN